MQDPEVDIDEFSIAPDHRCPACQSPLDDEDEYDPETSDNEEDLDEPPRDPTCLVCGGE